MEVDIAREFWVLFGMIIFTAMVLGGAMDRYYRDIDRRLERIDSKIGRILKRTD